MELVRKAQVVEVVLAAVAAHVEDNVLMGKTLVLATRKSKLALAQSNWVKKQIEKNWPDVKVELLKVTTKGDKILDVPLAKVGGKGLFVKEIEEALLDGRADIAVHSLKDVPTEVPEGLEVSIFPKRENNQDAFISNRADNLKNLPKGAKVGTSSLRRVAQIKMLRPDLIIESLRGNLDTRLKKLDDGLYDAIILAVAGLNRLGLSERITSILPSDIMLPAIGQGALGIEFRSNDDDTRQILMPIHHEETALCVKAERAFLDRLQGGCQVPIGGMAILKGSDIELCGLVADENGKTVIKKSMTGSSNDPESIGIKLAEEILNSGGRQILEEVYSEG